jgi:multiple sugar transport system permease protein
VEARYGGAIDNFKMAWSEESVDFYEPPYPSGEENPAAVALWEEFRSSRGPLPSGQAGLAFSRANKREAALENNLFRGWLLRKYGSLARLNEALLLEAPRATAILPPLQNKVILPNVETPFFEAFDTYMQSVPESHRLNWDIGGFFRSVYLPRSYGGAIANYNAAFGTNYGSFREVPFSATVPGVGADPWFQFIRRILNVSFVEFTPEGNAAWKESALAKVDFLRMRATPEQIRVVSLDREFAAWAKSRGVEDARIPQRELDWRDFQKTKAFWRWQFASQNFRYVIDEVLIQGNGVRNTLILVVLSIVSALTVNPMAAYALSRFKLPQSYQVLLFFLATIAFPAEVAMIPNFLQIKELGMINTFGALVIPGMVNGFSIFLLKGFFDSLPKELYEAADIDGASEWQIFFGITLNLSKPILAVIALGAFAGAYGAFMFALILAPDPSMWTLMVWIYQLQQNAGSGIVYASILLTAIPTLAVYLAAQNFIMRGIIVPTDK